MTRVRQSAKKDANIPQPHEPYRDKRQPYAKEQQEYSGGGVVRPPEENVGKRDEPSPSRKS